MPVARGRGRKDTEDDVLREDGDSDHNVLQEENDQATSKVPLLNTTGKDGDIRKSGGLKTKENQAGGKELAFCFIGLQASYLTWGYVQEKVMTKQYTTGTFPSATFCVFSNRVLAVLIAMLITLYQHKGKLSLPAPYYVFAPCALSNSLSSFGQYQALRYVSFPLQTISKSTKVIPVMLMGKVLNKKSYPCIDYIEAMLISLGVSIFSLAGKSGSAGSSDAGEAILGVSMLGLYIMSDSFTSQWQSRLYQAHPSVDQFQMMFAVNTWAIIMTLFALISSNELFTTISFLRQNPMAGLDNITIAITSATGQLFIFYTIKTFGPVVFTIIMTTRQVFSIVISCIIFKHPIPFPAMIGAAAVFGTIFYRIKRQAKNQRNRGNGSTKANSSPPANTKTPANQHTLVSTSPEANHDFNSMPTTIASKA